MPIETQCTTCGKTLRVGDEHAGSQARCPVCNTVYTVPSSSPPPAAVERWQLKTPEGQVFGPVSRPELDGWLSEGRISADCQLRCGEEAAWCPADEIYSLLKRPSPTPSANPFADVGPALASGPGVSPAAVRARSFLTPHRGGLVLTFGILAWVFTCPVFAVIAWVLASSDLREMREGRMDPSGQGLTQAGHILGVINALLWLAVMILVLFGLILAAAMS
jgi:hypothetical protein